MSDNKQVDFSALDFASISEDLQKNFKQMEDLMKSFSHLDQFNKTDTFNLGDAYSKWFLEVSKNPEQAMNAGMDFMQKSMQFTQQALAGQYSSKLQENSEQVIVEGTEDRRFKHSDWSEKPIFNMIKQSYLMTSEWMRELVTEVDGLDDQTAKKVKFFTERYLDAMSPTNFAITNPAVIEKTVETKGANLLHGLKNMLEDLETGQGNLKIRMTDTSAFTLGENIATTPGKVVFQNRMFQLIQYSPSTDTVLKRPLLIIPPWINKFYIMDLQPKNSLLKWMVEQGHTVFVISWINPDETYRDVGFEDYITEGVMTALDAVELATGENEINAVGYCIGGTLLSIALAYMRSMGDKRIKSATFLTTMIDFSEPGDLGVFIDDKQVTDLEKQMQEEGYLSGSKMSSAFNLLRANDLIWSFYINNYLLGNDPRPFDLLYWNSDSTRMTPTMHAWYLRNLYMENKLCEPNALTIKGVPLNLSSVDIPVCFVSTVDDHIAPWVSTYSGAKLFSGDVRFILGGSGHIAGIINHPDAKKYGFRVVDELPKDPKVWAEKANIHDGSWWPNWNNWVCLNSGDEKVTARQVGEAGLTAIEDAPGTYVNCRMDEPAPNLVTTSLDMAKKKSFAKKSNANNSTKRVASNERTDDLTMIKGVGPKAAEALKSAGINSYTQLVELSSEEIRQMIVSVNKTNKRYDTSNWSKQAMTLLSEN